MVTSALTLAWLLVAPGAGQAQTLAASAHAETVPTELAAPVAAVLGAGGVRVSAGPAILDFWWVRAVDVQPSASAGVAPSWTRVAQGTLVGVVRVAAPHRDIRGRTVKPGVYTLRYAVQPQNGDHMGVSPFREFLVVSPAGADGDPRPLGYEAAVDLAKKTLGSSHPAVLSIDPPEAGGLPLSVETNASGHRAVIVEVPVTSGPPLRFGVVLIGKIDA